MRRGRSCRSASIGASVAPSLAANGGSVAPGLATSPSSAAVSRDCFPLPLPPDFFSLRCALEDYACGMASVRVSEQVALSSAAVASAALPSAGCLLRAEQQQRSEEIEVNQHCSVLRSRSTSSHA